jgi:hypothetical protein
MKGKELKFKNIGIKCALARDVRDAGALLILSFICVASVFQDPAYKWNLSYCSSPRSPAPADHISPFLLSMSAHIQTPANFQPNLIKFM